MYERMAIRPYNITIMFSISSVPLETLDLRADLSSPKAGAFCSFEGLVRDHNDGKDVVALEYEAAESLCMSEADKILEEASQKFPIIKAKCFHRTGRLAIGEMAVWVGVISSHRDEGFKACRYIIDEIKVRLPIWKKEYYKDGQSEWVNCQRCAQHAH